MGKEHGLAYVSIGNSDDKLTQQQWYEFVTDVRVALGRYGIETHGEWFSPSESPFQNACWCVVVPHAARMALQQALARLAHAYGQDSIAYADVLFTTFIEPAEPHVVPANVSDVAGQAQTLELHPNCTPIGVASGQQPDQGGDVERVPLTTENPQVTSVYPTAPPGV